MAEAADRQAAILEAMTRMVDREPLEIPGAVEMGLGTRDEVIKVRVTVLRVSASNGQLIEAESETFEQDWNLGPLKFGMGLSKVCGEMAKKVWPLKDGTPPTSRS